MNADEAVIHVGWAMGTIVDGIEAMHEISTTQQKAIQGLSQELVRARQTLHN